MKNISLDTTKAVQFLAAGTVDSYEPKVKKAQEALENGTCEGSDFLGWLHLPTEITDSFLAVGELITQSLLQKRELRQYKNAIYDQIYMTLQLAADVVADYEERMEQTSLEGLPINGQMIILDPDAITLDSLLYDFEEVIFTLSAKVLTNATDL